jgi:mannose-6-phosphate isomerase-like protein (cupin superfamily)
MSKIESFVTGVEAVERQTWDDPRGRLAFHTLVSGEATPSNGLVAGVAIVEPGGELAPHSHAQQEIYFVLEGAALVTIEGVERKVALGATVFIPGHARHAIHNPFAETFRILCLSRRSFRSGPL